MRLFSAVLLACVLVSWTWYEVDAFDLTSVNSKLFYPNNDHKRSQHKYAILHMTNSAWFFQELSNLTLANKRRYARKYNVEMVVHTPYETHGLLEKTKECDDSDPYLVRAGSTCYSKLSNFEIDRHQTCTHVRKAQNAASRVRRSSQLLAIVGRRGRPHSEPYYSARHSCGRWLQHDVHGGLVHAERRSISDEMQCLVG